VRKFPKGSYFVDVCSTKLPIPAQLCQLEIMNAKRRKYRWQK
jgi:hypothetical protein